MPDPENEYPEVPFDVDEPVTTSEDEIDEPTEETVDPYADLDLPDGVGWQDDAVRADLPGALLDRMDPDEVVDLDAVEYETEGDDPGLFRDDDTDLLDPYEGLAGAMRPRSPNAAMLWAKGVTRYMPPGMCQQFTRLSFGIGPGAGSARVAWLNARKKHHVSRGADVPPGVPVYWLGGRRGFGHAAVSLGGGLCRSTDWPSAGRVGTARIDDISRQWGQRLVGWTEDINGVSIPGLTEFLRPKPRLILSNVIAAVRNKRAIKHGLLLKAAVAAEVGRGRMNLADPTLGSGFREQYRLVQAEYLRSRGQRVTDKAADGIPGAGSMAWLGSRRGFKVT